MSKIAILVDGGFYKKRARILFGEKTPEERADELMQYCHRHITDKYEQNELYRIFYYDCPPSEKVVNNPLTQRTVCLKKEPTYKWNNDFFKCLMSKRKVALRMGETLESEIGYRINPDVMKKLCSKKITVDDLKETDFQLDIKQKGVDMRIGIDIASLAFKKQVDRIILISGDSDFVPAAKYARREGIDFILDPMWQPIKDSLYEHIDGLQTKTFQPKIANGNVVQMSTKEKLCKFYTSKADETEDNK